jgi:hypothetical protein
MWAVYSAQVALGLAIDMREAGARRAAQLVVGVDFARSSARLIP